MRDLNVSCNTIKLRKVSKTCHIQNNVETCYWQRVELWNGKNEQDDDKFKDYLKWVIRNEAPKGNPRFPTGNAQRLNGSGSV